MKLFPTLHFENSTTKMIILYLILRLERLTPFDPLLSVPIFSIVAEDGRLKTLITLSIVDDIREGSLFELSALQMPSAFFFTIELPAFLNKFLQLPKSSKDFANDERRIS